MANECYNYITIESDDQEWLNEIAKTADGDNPKTEPEKFLTEIDISSENRIYRDSVSVNDWPTTDGDSVVGITLYSKWSQVDMNVVNINDTPLDAVITVRYSEWGMGFIGKDTYRFDGDEWTVEEIYYQGTPVEIASNPAAVEELDIDEDEYFSEGGAAYAYMESELDGGDIDDTDYDLSNPRVLDAVVDISKTIYNDWDHNPLESITGEDDITEIDNDDLKVMVKLFKI